MKNYKLLSIILLITLSIGCWNPKKSSESYFSIDESKLKEQYKPNDLIQVFIKNQQNKKIDSIVYYLNDKKVSSNKGNTKASLLLSNEKLGYQIIKATVYFEGSSQDTNSRVELVSNVEPKLMEYNLVNMYPHDTLSFTEGFEFHNDTLYESTGQKGSSYFRKYDYKTGKVFRQVNLDNQYFGEGITILDDQLYQLTWQSNVGFIYNSKSLKKEKTFTFDKKIEGWGFTNDGVNLYQSDGTEKIWKMDPKTQKMIDFINVYSNISKMKEVNELEWIENKIYCNVWKKDIIIVVNPKNGAVEGVLNLADLRKKVGNKSAEVLNGIAYNPKTKTIFVTGKNWDKIFELKIKN